VTAHTRGLGGNLPHPAVVCSGPQLVSVIEGLEAGTYPQSDAVIWRDDLDLELAIRLARATGGTDEQIAECLARLTGPQARQAQQAKTGAWMTRSVGPDDEAWDTAPQIIDPWPGPPGQPAGPEP
jgi:hypothetical protein